ncbi:hypothetical protein J4218_03275 [Candidatus Pacearchaeota archaeon]|nr:hypothetical protein [Candidatus Pacearchaeota archaeon]
MSTNKKELTIEECREAALKYFETLKSYAKQRVEMNPQEIISDLRDFTLHYLDINQIASLESVLQNAVRDLRFGARKRSAVNHYHESAQVILVPGNPELADKYDKVASYVSHAMFQRKHPF